MDPSNNTSDLPKNVLIVDLDRFSGLISKMLSEGFMSDTCSDGVQALRKLQGEQPDLILVEQNIQGSGIRLAELIGMNPAFEQIPIILMSVNPTADGILRARNAGVNTYLAKPFRPSELRSRIDAIFTPPEPALPPSEEEASEAKDEQGEQEDEQGEQEEASSSIKDRVKQIEGLPPFPATHAQILEMAQSDDSSSDDIAEKLQFDPSLLATIFKLVNSSHYGFNKKVDSLKLAVTLIGLEEIANLIMTAQVFKNLGDYEGGSGFDRDGFWRHSIGTAFICRAIAKKLQAEVESAFLAGMLHDLGKVVLDRCFADYYTAVIEHVQSEGCAILEAETQILGLNHADVGGQLATEWKFAEKYLHSIMFHHNTQGSNRSQRLVCLVHLADAICRQLEYGSGGDETVPEINQDALDRFSLGDRGLQILVEAAQEDLEGADSFMAALAT